MREDYPAVAGYIDLSEGGYTNNPADKGGPTNRGVTIYDARLYWKHDATAEDMRNIPKPVTDGILKNKYWDALCCDFLPAGLDYTVDDYGVNSGIARAGRELRFLVGLPVSDWHVTPDVIAKLPKDEQAIAELIEHYNHDRLVFLEGLSTYHVFGKGWSARVESVDRISLHMNAGNADPPPVAHIATAEIPTAKAIERPHEILAHLPGVAGAFDHFIQKVQAVL